MSKTEVVGTIQKMLFKLYQYLKEKFDNQPPLSEEESVCVRICLELISLPETYLTISPITKKRFIKNDSKDIFIIINNREISLINHIYGYNIIINNDDRYMDMITKFDLVLEKRREIMEDEMRKNIQHSLHVILNRIIDAPLEGE